MDSWNNLLPKIKKEKQYSKSRLTLKFVALNMDLLRWNENIRQKKLSTID